MHECDGVVHLGDVLIAQRPAPLHNLVQQAHQIGEVDLDRLLIVLLRPAVAVFIHPQHHVGRSVELLVQRLDLGAQGLNLTVRQAHLRVKPLTQHTARMVLAAGKLRAGVQRVAQVGRPLVMGRLRLLNLLQHIGSPDAVVLGPLNAQNIHCGHSAEQENRHNGARNADSDRSFDAFTHGVGPPSLFSQKSVSTTRAVRPAPSARPEPPKAEPDTLHNALYNRREKNATQISRAGGLLSTKKAPAPNFGTSAFLWFCSPAQIHNDVCK